MTIPFDEERHVEEAMARFTLKGKGRIRRLREGESVPVPELGLPNARLSGTSLSVMEFDDGTISAVIPNPAGLLQAMK
jgi:hypothetical protein